MDRRNLLLSGILVLQLALVAWLFWPSAGSNAAVGALITNLDAATVNAVKIQAGEAAIELAKEGEGWVLANYGGYPVDTIKVTDLISKVQAIDTSRLVARTASSHNRLQVADDEFAKKIDLTTADGQTQTLYVGSSPSLRSTNVRLAGSDLVYLTGEVRGVEIPSDVSGWVNVVYFQTPSTDVQAVTIENANGQLDFTKVSTDTWTLAGLSEGESFNQNNFETILTRLSGINLVAPVGKEVQPEYGLDTPSASVTVVTQPAGGEAKTLTFTIGAKDEAGNNYYAKSSESDFVVKIASFTGDQFVNDTRERYLQPPPAASSSLTTTEGLTTALPITSFAPLTPVEGITGTTAVTNAEELTTTPEITATEELTASADLTTSEQISEGEISATTTPTVTATPRP
jgi:hypothetical protein